ncbi:uncharacterized protein LOC125662345 isoform X2 [Ostrea edulis]|uniref:uncharacterized protein LOC125662345 isoform X2 n=1 Tax=Ostrea edulis TaxID=37623 RepID=UPI002095B763|nr:uncharacterized protein LOC125662345 isoform X2 [Ostrea edulis]
MLAVLILSALLGLALGDPLPPVKKHTQIIHVPAPKPQVVRVPALQEHPVRQVQHVPIRQTVVKQVNVPRDIVREVPVIVEKKLILRQPQIRKFPIDVQKTILQPYVKHVPQVRVNYRQKPYDVWHTRQVKKIINVPRPYPVVKHKIITKVLNRIVDVPHKVYKDRVKVVRVPQPFKVQKVHHRKIEVPVEVRVPVPRVRVKQTQEVQRVPIDVTVVKKVGIPKRTTLTEIVPVPVKPEGCGPAGVDCGSYASASSVTSSVGPAGVFAGGIETRGVAINEGPGLVDVSTIVDEAAPVIGGVTDIRRSFGSDGFPGASVDVERGLYGPDVPGYAPEVGVGGSARFESGFSIPGVPGPDTFADGSDSGGFAMPLPGSVEGSLESIHSSLGYNDDERFAAGVRSGSGFDLQQAQLDSRLYRGDGGFAARAEMMGGGAMLPGRGGIVYEERRTLPLYVGGEVRGRYVKSEGPGYGPNYDDPVNKI